ncbi:hypothetical protein [Brevibacillus borstelensis]|uniref:hypothetical protein n=1 Tax=Brevibacillus borstelensis TaxID=45462 RepID=UPI0030BAA5FA
MVQIIRSQAFALFLAGTLLLTGCGPTANTSTPPSGGDGKQQTDSQTPAPERTTPNSSSTHPPSPSSVEWNTAEIPFDYASMKADVLIRLDEEPVLQSPVRTTVGTGPQTFTLFFREAMDRSSVEEAVTSRIKERGSSEEWFIEPGLEFRWVHDKQLHLRATPKTDIQPRDGIQEYVLDVKGARTASGHVLAEPPGFSAVVLAPNQLWKVSLDGKVRERISGYPGLYGSDSFLDPDRRYLLLWRYTEYCECDARIPFLYGIYDRQTNEVTRYPVELLTSYRGEGTFVADRRGFFYAAPQKGEKVPDSESIVPVKIGEFVHGADFSHDRKKLIMAVGPKDQEQNLDLLLLDLESGEKQRLTGALKGFVPIDEMHGEVMPISFQDDGRQFTFAMRKSRGSFDELRYRFDWKTEKVSAWNPPVPKGVWAGYTQTDDGMYQMYWNAGLFKGQEYLMDSQGEGIWLPNSHRYLFTKHKENREGQSIAVDIVVFDADERKTDTLIQDLPTGLRFIGASADGQWLYLLSTGELQLR